MYCNTCWLYFSFFLKLCKLQSQNIFHMQFINEAMTMRQKRKELARTPPMKPNKLPVPVKSYT